MARDESDWLWWQHGVIYQIYPRSYGDTNGDGIGDLPGITAHIDYLHEVLGVDAIWLSPFYPSPMADFGYDVADYTDVHPMFGSLADVDRLLREAHDRQIRIVIDFVPNHSSDRHPWFLESRSSRESPKRDWYFWRDAKPDGSPPNNWQGSFGGGAWEWDEATQQYYLHSFLREQPDLNWRNPEVRDAMFGAVRFWLERGVDGFRIDVANMVMKDPELRDNPPNPNYDPDRDRPFDAILHVNDTSHSDVHALYADLRRLLDEYSAERPRMMVGEIHVYEWPRWATYYGPKLDEFHLPFNFGLIRSPWTPEAVRTLIESIENAVRPGGGWPNWVLGNHDEHRIASRVGPEAARVATMLLLTLRGTPTLYYGDEIGMHDVPIPPERIQDPFELMTPGRGLGRDPERTPMQWTSAPNAGFCPPEVEPWLPVAADADVVNVAAEIDAPHAMLTLTRALLRLRRAEPALHRGDYATIPNTPPSVFAYTRSHGDRRLDIALNFGEQEVEIPLPAGGTVLLSTTLDRQDEPVTGSLTLRPHEGCVIGSISQGTVERLGTSPGLA
jgi:alpha-glucosidase